MPAVSSVGRSGNVDIDGVLSGYKWTSGNLTYSFPTSVSQYGYSKNGFEAFNASQQAAVKSIFASYSSVANLSFTEVKESSSTHGTIRFGEENDAGTAFAYYPSTNEQGGDVWVNHKDYNAPAKGNYAYMTLVHEIGHTLGLDHGQDGRDFLPSNHDSIEYSVMTYRSYVGGPTSAYTVSQGSYASGPMLADIAALQYMYGANYNSNAGNNVYKWNASTGELTIDGASQGKSSTNTVFQTVWDGGGNDTYDFSGYSTNLTVDLNPGAWTTTSSAQLAKLGKNQVARGNIANAYLYQGNTASLIENAIGGSGNDRLTGNQLANSLSGGNGNDIFVGGLGNDTLNGGSGTDTAVFNVKWADAVVTYDSSKQLYTIKSADGTDTATGVESFAFLDRTVSSSTYNANTGTPPTQPTQPTQPATPSQPATPVTPAPTDAGKTFNGSSKADTINGTAGNDTINGGNGNDKLNGLGGNDRIDGGSGNDAMAGGAGDDTYVVNSSKDVVTEKANEGTDTVLSSVTHTLASNVENLTLTGSSATSGTGNSLNNALTGNNGVNTLNGGDGNDTLFGLSGVDTLVGGNGSDRLSGGLGMDTLTGGAGADYFVFDSALSSSNVDKITDFSVADDTILLDSAIFSALGKGNLDGGDFATKGSLGAALAHVIYDAGTGALFYDDDGYGGGAAVQFATLGKGLSLTASDFNVI